MPLVPVVHVLLELADRNDGIVFGDGDRLGVERADKEDEGEDRFHVEVRS